MNHEHLMERLRAAIRLPGNLQKSCKFFCRGLDIRVAHVMKSDPWQPCPLQYPMEHMPDAVRRNGTSVRRRKYILVVCFLSLGLKDFYRVRTNG